MLYTRRFLLLLLCLWLSASSLACDDESSKDDNDMSGDVDMSDLTGDAEPDATDMSDDGDVSDIPDDTASDTDMQGDAPSDMDLTDGTDADTDMPQLPLVEPLYPDDGVYWTHHVVDDGDDPFTASGTPCDPALVTTEMQTCLHAGELRVFETPELNSCENVTATDSEDAFDWVCDDSGNTVRVISTNLKDDKLLRDLIDFEAPNPRWKSMSVTVDDGSRQIASASSQWWANSVVLLNGMTVPMLDPWDVAVMTGNALRGVQLTQNNSFTTSEGAIPSALANSGNLVSASDFAWVEGHFGALEAYTGITVNGVYLNFRDIEVLGPDRDGISGSCRYCDFRDITVVNPGDNGVDLNMWDTTITDLRVENPGQSCMDFGFSQATGNVVDGLVCLSPESYGLELRDGGPLFYDVLIANSGRQGVYVYGDDVTIDGLIIINAGRDADYHAGIEAISNYSRFYDVAIFNSSDDGFWIRSATDDNAYMGVVSVGNNGPAINDGRSNAGGHFLSDLTLAHNTGLGYDAGGEVSVVRAAMFNNGGDGFQIDISEGVFILDMASTDNRGDDIESDPSIGGGVKFSGHLIVTDPATSCNTIIDEPGDGIDDTCNPIGLSDFTLSTGSMDGAFVGPISTDDAANDSDTTGASPYDNITDWAFFDHRFRGWARDGQTLDDLLGRCMTGDTCRIHDLSLVAGGVIHDVLPPPTDGDDTVTHVWHAESPVACDRLPGAIWTGLTCENVFLRNTREIHRDGIGNDNGFCESNEECYITRNIGAYQGHGPLVETATIGTGGTIENVTLYDFTNNGR